MTQAAFGGTAFSTQVKLWLECEHGNFPLAQVGADFVIAAEACDIPPNTTAVIVVSINDRAYRHRYLLHDGLSQDNPRSRMVPCEEDGIPF